LLLLHAAYTLHLVICILSQLCMLLIFRPSAAVCTCRNTSIISSFTPNRALLERNAAKKAVTSAYLFPNAAPKTFKLPTTSISRRFILQSTQPLIESNGMLRWALDSIAYPVAPPCKPVIDAVYANPNWVSSMPGVPSNGPNQQLYFTPVGGNASTWEGDGKNLQVSCRRHSPLPAFSERDACNRFCKRLGARAAVEQRQVEGGKQFALDLYVCTASARHLWVAPPYDMR
jgi:hypothetical protein